jgi:Tol biopolymer transport system component
MRILRQRMSMAPRPFLPLFGLILALLAWGPGTADAQYFGRNKVQYDTFDFQVLKTPHFDFHYYPEEGEAIEDAARQAERWYERFARTFQHEFEAPKPVIMYADHPDFQQTNTLSGTLSEGTGGVTESIKNRVIMPFTGSYWETDHVLGHELVHAFQYNVAGSASGGGLQGLFRNPLWLIEGMAEYMSVGREDPLTGMWLRDALLRDDFPTIRSMTTDRRFFPYRFGQALWAFIGGTWGDDAVVQVFRRSLRVGFGAALEQVLGMHPDTLSIRWREAVEEEYLPLMAGRTPPGEAGALLLSPATGAGRQNVSPAVSPDGRYVAFLSEKDLFSIDLFLADARTGEILKKLVSANADPHFDALRFIDSAGTWSPDGRYFAFVVFANGDNELAILDVEKRDVVQRIKTPGVGAISNPAWSPNGQAIAFSGQVGGFSDLYLVFVETEEMVRLTQDKHADFHPTWSPDGKTIAFTSDRGPGTDFDILHYSDYQISMLDVATNEIRVLDLFGDVKHINPQFTPSGEGLYFVSDQDGFQDIYLLDFTTDEIRRVTNVATSVSGIGKLSPAMSVAQNTGTMVYSIFTEFEFHIYSLDLQENELGGPVVAENQPAPGRMLPPSQPRIESRIAEYLADPETGLVRVGTFAQMQSEEYKPGLQLDYIGQPSLGVGVSQYGGYLAGGAAFYFSDMLGNRNLGITVSANGTIKDIGGSVFYVNRERRWNWGGNVGRYPYLRAASGYGSDEQGNLIYSQLLQRIFIDNAEAEAQYPFSTTRRLETKAGFTRYSYDTELRNLLLDDFGRPIGEEVIDIDDPLYSPDPLNLINVSVGLVADNSFFAFTSPISGGRSRFSVEQMIGTLNFTNLTLDWRRYFNPVNPLTFAIRGLHYGRYGSGVYVNTPEGKVDDTRLFPIFLGTETLMRGYSWESFNGTAECTQISEPGSVAPCQELERLYGHRIATVNLEVRLPLIGTDQYGLIALPYIPVEILFFQDIGFAWDDTIGRSDFKWEFNTTDPTARVPLFSSGAGARFNILGFMILEAHYVYPWQRPDKGGHWGFVLAPGW